MVSLQSTSFQFGGAILSTDDPHLMARLNRIIDMLTLFLIQANSLLMELRVLVGLQTTVYQRILDLWDDLTDMVETMLDWCMWVYVGFERLMMPQYGRV